MRKTMLEQLVLGLVMALALPAVGAWAADCGDTSGPLGTDVPCSCGDTVTTSTVLNSSDPVTTTTCPGDGLTVDPGVMLNLGRQTLRGQGQGIGVILSANPTLDPDPPLTTVTDGKIINFDTGVSGFNLSLVSLLQVLDNDFRGVHLEGDYNLVERNTVSRTLGRAGIEVVGDGNVVRLNLSQQNAFGVIVDGVNNEVVRNTALRNSFAGLSIGGEAAIVDRNRGNFTSGGPGFEISGANHIAPLNLGDRNAGNGFSVNCDGCTFDRNRASYNGGYGIEDKTAGGPDSVYTANICTGNALGDSAPPGLCR